MLVLGVDGFLEGLDPMEPRRSIRRERLGLSVHRLRRRYFFQFAITMTGNLPPVLAMLSKPIWIPCRLWA